MDKEYWEKYYSAKGPSHEPSDFARFFAEKYRTDHGAVFDVGCGNGRDTFFFVSQEIPCCGVDQSRIAIEKNRTKAGVLGLNASFHHGDLATCDYALLANGAFSIYSRFNLHAISREEEDKWFLNLNNGSELRFLFIEARTISDDLYGQGKEIGLHEFVTSHYRRFIDPLMLKSKLETSFEVLSLEEGRGFAMIPTEDPCLIRVVAKRR